MKATSMIIDIYPSEVMLDAKRRLSWIKSLSKEALHQVVQDKNLPLELFGDLAKNVPIQFLKNLSTHKKLPMELRVPILRRIYSAKIQEMNHAEKLNALNTLVQMKNWSEREKQITNSYITEVKKQIEGQSLTSTFGRKNQQNVKPKSKKLKQDSPKIIDQIRLALGSPRESSKHEVAEVVLSLLQTLVEKEKQKKKELDLCAIRVSVLTPFFRDLLSSRNIIDSELIPIEELILLQIQINLDLFLNETRYHANRVIASYKDLTRGQFAEDILAGNTTPEDPYKLLFEMLLKLSASDDLDYENRRSWLMDCSTSYPALLKSIKPILEKGGVHFTTRDSVSIQMRSSIVVDLEGASVKYWRTETEDESDAFSEPLRKVYSRKERLFLYDARLTHLKPGVWYSYLLTGIQIEKALEIPLQKFQMPSLEPVLTVKPPGRSSFDYRDYSVPTGQGTERRHQQFNP